MKTLANSVSTVLVACLLALPITTTVADTLELRDGRHLEGEYVGGSSKTLHFRSQGVVGHYPLHAVRELSFSERDMSTPNPDPEPTRTIIAPAQEGLDAMTIQRVPATEAE